MPKNWINGATCIEKEPILYMWTAAASSVHAARAVPQLTGCARLLERPGRRRIRCQLHERPWEPACDTITCRSGLPRNAHRRQAAPTRRRLPCQQGRVASSASLSWRRPVVPPSLPLLASVWAGRPGRGKRRVKARVGGGVGASG